MIPITFDLISIFFGILVGVVIGYEMTMLFISNRFNITKKE
jgi:hypothetical protein